MRAFGDLVVQPRGVERDQVGVAEALRVQLPAGGDQPLHLARPRPPCEGGRPLSWMFSTADPAEPAQDRQRLRVLRLIAVVEADHDRFARGQRDAAAPVGLRAGPCVTACQPAPASALHLLRELCGRHVQARERRAGGRRRDHVVHEDRHGRGARPRRCRARAWWPSCPPRARPGWNCRPGGARRRRGSARGTRRTRSSRRIRRPRRRRSRRRRSR